MRRAFLWLCLAIPFLPPALGQLPLREDPALTIGTLAHNMRSPDRGTRLINVKALSAFAGQLQLAVTVLRGRLKRDPDAEVRAEVAQALANIGPSAYEAVPELIEALGDKDKEVRHMAALALGKIGRYAGEAVPALMRALKDKSKAVRRRAVMALGGIGPDARQAVPALITVLDDPDPSFAPNEPCLRYSAIIALGRLGPDAKAAVPALLKLQEMPNATIRGLCMAALAKIGTDRKTVLPVLMKGLELANTRADAAFALAVMKPPPKEAVPALLKALRAKPIGGPAEERRIKMGIIKAMAAIAPNAKEVVPVLRELTKDSDAVIRAYAQQSLQQIEGSK
jgi:HEAT repeat protein